MGLLRNDDRRSAEKGAKKRSKAEGQAADTIVPEPVSEPVSVARKNVLDALAHASDVAAAVDAYLPVPEEGGGEGETAAVGQDPAISQAQRETEVRGNEAPTFSLHLDAEPKLVQPTLPSPEPPDPQAERERIERELGIPELAGRLAQYGAPPVAPAGEPADRQVLERDRLRAATAHVSRW